MCLPFFLVVPPALSTFWWFRDSEAIISSVPPLPTPPVSPVPVTPPIISVPPASFSVTTVAVTAAAVAIPVSVAVAIPVSMVIPVSVTVIATVPIASVAVPVVTVSMAPPVLSMSLLGAVSLWGRCRWSVAVLWTGLTGRHWAQRTCAGKSSHEEGGTMGPFWSIGSLCRYRT